MMHGDRSCDRPPRRIIDLLLFPSLFPAILNVARLDRSHREQLRTAVQEAGIVDMYLSEMYSCTFKGAVMRGCDFTKAELSYADLSGAKLINVRFNRTQT